MADTMADIMTDTMDTISSYNGENEKRPGLVFYVRRSERGMTARGVLMRTKGVSQRLIGKIAHAKGEDDGALYINGRPARFKDRVKSGDEIRLVFPKEETWMEPQEIPLETIYEDGDILAINKQPGMVVHPTKNHKDGTIANAIVFYMKQRGEDYKPRFISRLDMDTTGILLIGKNSHAQDSLARQGAEGLVKKVYTAVLEGRLEDDLPPCGMIDLPVGQAVPGDPRRSVLPEEEGGYNAQTGYEVQQIVRLDNPACSGEQRLQENPAVLTVVRIRLFTGRTHQIRVHFAHFGHPVLGDLLYGNSSPLIPRQALHATEFSFVHPATGCDMHLEAPLPQDMADIINQI